MHGYGGTEEPTDRPIHFNKVIRPALRLSSAAPISSFRHPGALRDLHNDHPLLGAFLCGLQLDRFPAPPPCLYPSIETNSLLQFSVERHDAGGTIRAHEPYSRGS